MSVYHEIPKINAFPHGTASFIVSRKRRSTFRIFASAGSYFSQVKAHSFIVFSSTLRKQSFKTLSNFFITNTVFFVFHAAKVRHISAGCINRASYFTLFICLKTWFYKHVTGLKAAFFSKSRCKPLKNSHLFFLPPPRPARIPGGSSRGGSESHAEALPLPQESSSISRKKR